MTNIEEIRKLDILSKCNLAFLAHLSSSQYPLHFPKRLEFPASQSQFSLDQSQIGKSTVSPGDDTVSEKKWDCRGSLSLFQFISRFFCSSFSFSVSYFPLLLRPFFSFLLLSRSSLDRLREWEAGKDPDESSSSFFVYVLLSARSSFLFLPSNRERFGEYPPSLDWFTLTPSIPSSFYQIHSLFFSYIPFHSRE